jgi:hypothetical protein
MRTRHAVRRGEPACHGFFAHGRTTDVARGRAVPLTVGRGRPPTDSPCTVGVSTTLLGGRGAFRACCGVGSDEISPVKGRGAGVSAPRDAAADCDASASDIVVSLV